MIHLTNRDYAHFYFDEIDLDAQLLAIRSALSRNRQADKELSSEITALAERAKAARGTAAENLVGAWVDELHGSVYRDAAHSAAAVGMLAPLVESLFVTIFRGVGGMGVDAIGARPKSDRSNRAVKQFWDPHVYFGSKTVREDLVLGIVQLADASGLRPFLPGDLPQILKALFLYRNRMLHSGFEWPAVDRVAFGREIAKLPAEWFKAATSDGKPWIYYLSELFVRRVLDMIEEVLEGAGAHLRLHYESEERPSRADEKTK